MKVGDEDVALIEVRLPGGIISHAPVSREMLASLGKLLAQLANDPTRTGVRLELHDNSDVSLSSKGIGGEGGRA
jgi:hypothetical protein